MIREYVKGDIVELFRTGNDIAHGCNCFHTMGAGVAGQLAQNFKQVPGADHCQSVYADHEKLGFFTHAVHDNDTNVCYNLYTQFEPGPNVDYGAIFNAFSALNKIRKNSKSLYIPRIGAGIAGGDWKIIEKLINLATPDIQIVVVDYCANPVILDTGEVVSLDFLEIADKIKRDPKRLP